MRKIFIVGATVLIFIIFLISCSSKSNESSSETDASDELLIISQAQFDSEKMEIGNSSLYQFEEIVKINGYILAPVDGIAQVNTHVSGLISNIYFSTGNYVNKGQILCALASKEFISLQQEFAETASRLKSLKLDYERAKVLIEEKIGSQKEFISIESEYKSNLAKYEGLKSQLTLIGIHPKQNEDINIISTLNLHAPISGYITTQKCVIGQYAEPNQALFEIVDMEKLQLQLFVYEKDISKLQEGQQVRYSIQGKENETYLAELVSVGKSIDLESKTIPCIAKMKKEDSGKFVNRMYVEAEIIVEKRKAMAISNHALLKAGEEHFLLIEDKTDGKNHYFRKRKVNIGTTANDFTEIIENEILKNVLVNGVYNIQIE